MVGVPRGSFGADHSSPTGYHHLTGASVGKALGHIGVLLGLSWGYLFGLSWGYIGVILGLSWGNIGVILGFYWGSFLGNIRVILKLY